MTIKGWIFDHTNEPTDDNKIEFVDDLTGDGKRYAIKPGFYITEDYGDGYITYEYWDGHEWQDQDTHVFFLYENQLDWWLEDDSEDLSDEN